MVAMAGRRVVRIAPGLVVGLALAMPLLSVACTTFVHGVACGDRERQCGERHDIRFCEYVALEVDGPECERIGLAASRPFCFVSSGPCVSTTYATKDSGCQVVRYELLREWSQCSPGAPTFASAY
jgi:hypothetical protein